MKLTLLDIVQDLLSSIDGDEVNSINDTQESMDVARAVRESYYHIVGIADLPEHYSFFSLDVVNTNYPTLMSLPSNVIDISWIKYNNIKTGETNNDYLDVLFQDMNSFISGNEAYNTDDTFVDTFPLTIGTATLNFKYRNDKMPQFFTTWDDQYVLFDSLDTSEDNNLQQSKTWCYGLLDVTFLLSDTFVHDLDHKQFPLLLNEAKSQISIEKRQQANPKAESRARHNWINIERTKRGIPSPYSEYNNISGFGRIGPISSTRIQALRKGT